MTEGAELPGIGLVRQHDLYIDDKNALTLESGVAFGPLNIRYECYGTLNADKSNAVLIVHAFSGDAHAAGYHSSDDRKPGWWDSMIGPGKAFDTDRYFIICSNTLGGCTGTSGPGSINPASGEPYALDFPVITIQDMVETQRILIDHLGIDQLLAIAGGSMGGMQVLEWSIRYPERLRTAIVIASTGRLSAQGIAFNAVGRNAIMSDPHWNGGQYYGKDQIPRQGLSIARMVGHITYLSEESMRVKFGRRLQTRDDFNFDFSDQFQVESYLEYQGDQFVERFDANSYIYLSKAMDYYDFSSRYGTMDSTIDRSTASFLVISYSSDWLFPSYQSKELVYAMMRRGKDVSYTELDSPYGHDAFLLETGRQEIIVSSFLKSAMEGRR
ncbi:homoserine O-acetyltransferase MetX [Salinispira pacifica]|uniref:Homoserine O-acetyltransferase n=1 Tax=Salinispira pacifica TaxID=1307761 RepID=V5WFT9_9SPIO|nr:homoserine O-acetyltransferase [Salinispira pacifica]AHC14653.1 Homoserine O-acetyltransferase [Salinispira pacifica]